MRSSDLPEVIRRYLLADTRTTPVTALAHADRIIQRLITDTDGRLAKLKLACQKESKANRNRPGDKLQRTIRAGHLADWLARDIMRLQPCLHHEQACLSAQQTGKATSLLFSELQARLAFYGRDKPLVPALCQRMALINSPNPHPFLQSVLDAHPARIVECYQSYLENKRRWLHTLQQQLSQQPEHVLSQHHWLLPKPRPQSETDIHHHIKKLKSGTLNLPRGLFAEPIKALIAGLDNPTLQQAIEHSERINSSYMLQLYMQHVRQDGYPPVYTLERHYKTIDKACDDRAGRAVSLPVTPVRMQGRYDPHDSTHPSYIARLTDWISTENVEANLHKQHKRMPDQAELTAAQTLRKRAVNSVAKTEKRLRQIRTHDQVMFLMMEQLLALNPEHNQPLRHLKLNTLSRRTLSQTVDYSLTLHRTTIQASNICLKNIGHFRRLLKDRRLPGLLPHLDRTLSDTALQQQLEAYQHQRLRAFKLMLAFEQAIVDQYGPPTAINMRSQHAGLLDHLFNQLGAGGAQDDANKASMAVIRNAFCHNQFPSADFPRTQTHYPAALPMLQQAREHWRDDSCPSVAEYFVNLLETCYQHYLPEAIQETQP